MTEYINISPLKVRGRGNIVDVKNNSDEFVGNYSTITKEETQETIEEKLMTVYTETYKTGSYLTVDNITRLNNGDFQVTVKLKAYIDDGAISDASIICVYDDSTETTDSNGQAVFTITPEEDFFGFMTIKLYWTGNTTYGGCFKGVQLMNICEDNGEITAINTTEVVNTEETTELFVKHECNGIGVPGSMIKFYEEYTPSRIFMVDGDDLVASGGSIDISALLKDTDGSGIQGETVKFYIIE